MVDHSPIPWRKIAQSIVAADNDPICHMAPVFPGVRGDDRKLPDLDSAFILQAVNSHEALLEALQQCAHELGSLHHADSDVEHAKAHSAGLRMALDAIAKAEGR